jgi:IclR family acetate operon transcriptional repressor
VDVALAYGEADVVQSENAAESQAELLDDELRRAAREAASVEIVTVPARHAAQNTLSLCESREKHATPLCEIACLYAYTRAMSHVDDVPRGTLGTVRNATLLLELLGQGAAFQQLTELAERSGLSLPTVHRLLRSLVAAGLVEQDPDSARYGLGAELVRLAERYLSRLPIFRAVSPYLVELRNTTGATVLAALLVRGQVVYFDRVDGADAGGIFREPSRMHPALETAAGRLLIARSQIDSWEDAVAASRNGSFTLADRKRWAKASYVVLVDDNSLAEVAVPILAANGRPTASLVATGSPQRFSEEVLIEEVAPQLARAAAAVARTLSHV